MKLIFKQVIEKLSHIKNSASALFKLLINFKNIMPVNNINPILYLYTNSIFKNLHDCSRFLVCVMCHSIWTIMYKPLIDFYCFSLIRCISSRPRILSSDMVINFYCWLIEINFFLFSRNNRRICYF